MPDIDRRRGRFVARWREPDGRQRSKSFDRAGDARRHLTEVGHKLNAGTYIPPEAGKLTLSEYAASWLAGLTTDALSIEATEMRWRVHILPALGSLPLAGLRPSTVQQFVAGLGKTLSPRYVASILVTLSACLSAAVDDGKIASNPCRARSVNPPRIAERKVVPWTAEEVAAVRAALPERYAAMVDCGAGLGMRISEVLGLRVEDVDFLHRTVHVRQQIRRVGGVLVVSPPKGGRQLGDKMRDVPLPETVGLRLAEHVKIVSVSELIFTTATGGMISRGTFGHIWGAALDTAGLGRDGRGFHQLRHYFVSLLLGEAVSVAAVAAYTGDTPATILRYYSHMMPSADGRMRSAIDRAMSEPADRMAL